MHRGVATSRVPSRPMAPANCSTSLFSSKHGGVGLTPIGISLGDVETMAPEQVFDARADMRGRTCSASAWWAIVCSPAIFPLKRPMGSNGYAAWLKATSLRWAISRRPWCWHGPPSTGGPRAPLPQRRGGLPGAVNNSATLTCSHPCPGDPAAPPSPENGGASPHSFSSCRLIPPSLHSHWYGILDSHRGG